MLRHASKNNSNNNTNNNSNNSNNTRNDQAKIYFPSISIQVLQNALHGTPNSNKKQNHNQNITQTQTQNITQTQTQNITKTKTQLDKYICSENQNTTIYGTTCILEILNNEPYAVYPSDKIILTSSISVPVVGSGVGLKQQHQQHQQHLQLQLLVDYSIMKRSQTPSYQLPYDFKVHSCLVKKYKMNPKSNTTFVIEYKDNKVYDFYVLAKLSGLPGLSGNRIEIDNFIKEDIISFLLMLNLY